MASDKRQGWNEDISGCLYAQMCHAVAWSVDWEIVSKRALKIRLGGKCPSGEQREDETKAFSIQSLTEANRL